jgi:hypothetical protein
MENIININHSFLRKELDNSIILILDYQKEWQDKNINFKLKNQFLEISLDDELPKWHTELINPLLIDSLKNKQTAVLINGGEQGLSEGIIEPLIKKKKNRL